MFLLPCVMYAVRKSFIESMPFNFNDFVSAF